MSSVKRFSGVRAAVSAFVVLTCLVLVASCSSGEDPSGSSGRGSDSTGDSGGSGTQAPPSSEAKTQPAAVTMNPGAGAVDVSPSIPITLTATGGTLQNVAVTNPAGEPVAGAVSADGLTWSSSEPLGYGKTYTVQAQAINAKGAATPFSGQVTTVEPSNLTLASITPNGGTVGVGQPIAVHFDEPITDKAAAEKSLVVTTNPPVAGGWYWFDDQNVHWRPQTYWPAGTSITVDAKVYGVSLGNGLYGQEDSHSTFAIGRSMVGQADANELVLRFFQDGQLIKEMPTSMGKPQFPTESGSFVIQEKHETYKMDSSTWGLPTDDPNGYVTTVNWAVRMSAGGVFTHAAPWSVADQGVQNVSHGCLNLSDENAKWVYDNLIPGDVIEVTGTGVQLQPGNTYGDWSVSWDQWLAGSALA